MMASKVGGGIVVIPAEELMGKISDLMDDKLSEFVQAIRDTPNVSPDAWLKINEFCSINQTSRSTVYRLIQTGKIEVKELSPRNKLYRWTER